MTEEGKSHFDYYKYLCFPWGALAATPIWFGIVKAIEPFINNLSFTNNAKEVVQAPWWSSWLIFAIGEIIIFAFLAFYSYSLPKGKSNSHNIFILIAPELFQDDKYITNDFVECFERHASGSIQNLNIIVPATLKREAFIRTITHYQKKQKKYWESKRWKKLHRKLKGVLYISGVLKRRSSNGKEKYVFVLSVTVGYNNINKNIAPLMIDELKKNFPSRILINKEFELEEFETMTDRFATFSEYLIGWAHLVSGNIDTAYIMHYDIYSNNKQSFFKRGALNDLTQLLHIELDSLLTDCKIYSAPFIFKCIETANKLYPNSDTSTLMAARALIMTSTNTTFDTNLLLAQSLLKKARINSRNKEIIHADRAYVYLLTHNYSSAESEYQILFKKPKKHILESVVEYCDKQIKDGCERERPIAYYVKALMLSHLENQENALNSAIKQAKKCISSENTYLQNKLTEMECQCYVPKRKKNKKGHKHDC